MPGPRLTFGRKQRLSDARQFQKVYAARMKTSRGPFAIYTRPNDRDFPRLGLSIGRVVGGAVARNRVKRLIREAFRHLQHEVPTWNAEVAGRPATGSFDIVVAARAHEPLEMDAVRTLIREAIQLATRDWDKRLAKGWLGW